MMKIINFDNEQLAPGVFYGGDAGAKEAIIYNDAVWMIKYPKTTRDMINPKVSYTTSPLSEYLGSKIYELLGFPTHEVLLGTKRNKIVVACKDFTKQTKLSTPNETIQLLHSNKTLIHFHYLKNSFMANEMSEYSGTGSETYLDEVLATIANEQTFKLVNGVVEHFWDMFVIDAFIGNNDRNNGNWGLLWDNTLSTAELAPIYDNGNAFFNKRSLDQMTARLNSEQSLIEDAFKVTTCIYKDENGNKINPFNLIEQNSQPECTKAVHRFLESVDLDKIRAPVESIPESIESLTIMPDVQKEFYLRLLEIRLDYLRSLAEGFDDKHSGCL